MVERMQAGLIGLLAAHLATMPALAATVTGEEPGVGVVAAYRPATARFSIERASRRDPVPVQIATVVVPGDRVTLPAGASITVQLANGQTNELKGPGSHTIRDTGVTLSSIFRTVFTGVFDDEFRHEALAGSRGSERCAVEGEPVKAIEVPILARDARIVSGERDLPLAWRGGCAPFVVAVLASGKSLVDRESIEGRQVRLDDVPLAPGRYTVVITDIDNRRFEASLEATGTGPVVPAELAADTSSLGVVAQALWLADHEGGRWRLESFERLRPLIRAGDPLANAIGDGVLWGAAAR